MSSDEAKCLKQVNTGTGSTNCQLENGHGGYCSQHAIAMRPRENCLQVPLNEIEKAELTEACRLVLKPEGQMLFRRALYQLDALKTAAEQSRLMASAKVPKGYICHCRKIPCVCLRELP